MKKVKLYTVSKEIIGDKEVPFTATHYRFDTEEFLRFGKYSSVEVFLNDEKWVRCKDIHYAMLPTKLTVSACNNYMRLFKTGVSRDICNIRLMFIGSTYRIK